MESKINLIPIGLLSTFTLKLLFVGTNPSEMGIVFALSAVVYGTEYLSKSRRIQHVENDNKNFTESVTKKLEEQATIITKQNEVIKTLAVELAQVKDGMSSVKMSVGMQGLKRTGT